MTSTLKRTVTDIMEDELYTSVQPNEQSNMNGIINNQLDSSQSQNDFLQYISLPNVSQDSLQKILDSEDVSVINDSPNIQNNASNTNNTTNNIYNSYANPNSFANPHLADYLYNNNDNLMNGDNTLQNNVLINPQATNPNLNIYSQQQQSAFNHQKQDSLHDDVLMVPQDNFYLYDQQDSQFIPEMMQLELTNKSFPQSNELNIFKANDVFYEFSDEEDDDDDIDLQNKLDDDDMEMNLDDDEEDEDNEEDSQVHYNNFDNYNSLVHSLDSIYGTTNDEENNNANNYLLSNDNTNSIYSLTVPNEINPSLINSSFPKFPASQQVASPLENIHNTELYHTDFEHGIEDDEDEEEEDDDDDEDEDEEEDNSNLLDIDSGDLYTSAFEQRKESVTADSKPVIKKERSSSLRPTTRPKRLRRSSAILSNNMHPSITSLRKPRSSVASIPAMTTTESGRLEPPAHVPSHSHSHSISPSDSYIDPKSEDHVCTIANPKTGKPCLKKFSRPYDLVRHQNTIHASKRSFYRCMFCEDDLRRKHDLDSINDIVTSCKYRDSQFSIDNSQSHITSSHNVKKIKSGALNNSGYLSNKTFSRCDALTRHLRFRHGLNNSQVVDAMDYAKKNVEYYDN